MVLNPDKGQAEHLKCSCPWCRTEVLVLWINGVVPKKEYVLLASWVYHSDCFDNMIKESPP